MTLAPDKMGAIIQALEYIHEHPEEWNQAEWRAWVYPQEEFVTARVPIGYASSGSCGTVACLAGRISIQQPEFELAPSLEYPGFYEGSVVRYRGENQHVSYAVSSFLTEGSSDPDSDAFLVRRLFYATNSENNLWYFASQLTDEDLTPPPGVSFDAWPVEDDDYEF
jgi:hypothetical protein